MMDDYDKNEEDALD